MPTVVPSIKLPDELAGYVLLLHTGFLFFWLYSRLNSNYSQISNLLPISISGIIVGCFMYYIMGHHFYIERQENKTESEIFGSAKIYWFFAFIAYLILYFVISELMQPPVQTAWTLH